MLSNTEISQANSLANQLRARIQRDGPIAFRDWMEAALYDDCEGYYSRGDRTRWGRVGDYRTSPERSPLFGATFARYFVKLYEEMGAPSELKIIEVGAGGGHFAKAVLKTLARQFPKLFEITKYLIDERSPLLRNHLRETLKDLKDRVDFMSLNNVNEPMASAIICSNELIDAMPVHRVITRQGKLLEFYVALNGSHEFVWLEAEPSSQRLSIYFEDLNVPLLDGQIAEVNLAADDWLCSAASKLSSGYIVTIDYGAEANELYDFEQRPNGTLRTFSRHRVGSDALSNPGTQDITTTVNWTQLKSVGAGCGLENVRFERQDRFLIAEGLLDQLTMMTEGPNRNAIAAELRIEARDLVLPTGMSAHFNVLVQRRRTLNI